MSRNHLLVCLLPARDAEEDLPRCLASLSTFCDAVVALDDGSVDGTRRLLDGHPLVAEVLSRPPRVGFREWHDGELRNTLLRAAADLRPTWIVSVDSDECLAADDAAALRRFVETDAVPGCAFGLTRLRMWGADRYEAESIWHYRCVFRLFAYSPGDRFPDRRLHFNPVPTSIPDRKYVMTTIRLQDFGACDEARTAARSAKYLEADHEDDYREYHDAVCEIPRDLRPWMPRPEGLPVILRRASDRA